MQSSEHKVLLVLPDGESVLASVSCLQELYSAVEDTHKVPEGAVPVLIHNRSPLLEETDVRTLGDVARIEVCFERIDHCHASSFPSSEPVTPLFTPSTEVPTVLEDLPAEVDGAAAETKEITWTEIADLENKLKEPAHVKLQSKMSVIRVTRPPVDYAKQADVVVVGAGPVGLWTAIQIQLRFPDAHVVMFEKHSSYQRRHVLRLVRRSLAGALSL